MEKRRTGCSGKAAFRSSSGVAGISWLVAMGEVNVQLNNGPSAQIAAPVTVAEALKKLDRDVAKQALAARVNGREVDLAYQLESANGDAIRIEPVLPDT